MSNPPPLAAVLRRYPASCQPRTVEYLAAAGGFSGARFWRLETLAGKLCLRRWPRPHPKAERLRFIHGVLHRAATHGLRNLLPVPLETLDGQTFIEVEEHLWELAPWLPGAADYSAAASPTRLRAALATLATFHRTVESHPTRMPAVRCSPGLAERLEILTGLLGGKITRLAEGRHLAEWPELADRAPVILGLFERHAPGVLALLVDAVRLEVDLQPCLRDIWHDHVLFVGDEVSGLVDFGAMRIENVAGDVARLLGSLAVNDRQQWAEGLAAYEAIRPLTPDEKQLLATFDRSAVLMSGVQWLKWIAEGRNFDDPQAVLARIDHNLERLRALEHEDPFDKELC